jgi:hypothetical protein
MNPQWIFDSGQLLIQIYRYRTHILGLLRPLGSRDSLAPVIDGHDNTFNTYAQSAKVEFI